MIEEKSFFDHIHSIKDLFFGGNGALLQNIADKIFRSSGSVKGLNLFRLTEIIQETLPEKASKYLKTKITVMDSELALQGNFVDLKLATYCSIHSQFPTPLDILFNPNIMKIIFEIFVFVLKVAKLRKCLSKTWKNLRMINQRRIPSHIAKLMIAVFTSCSAFINEFSEYVFFLTIEGGFRKFTAALREAVIFNQVFKLLTEMLTKIFAGCFLSRDYMQLYERLKIVFVSTIDFYKIVFLLGKAARAQLYRRV
jgi:hypothetical protein